MNDAARDTAQLQGLLRRLPQICTTCASVKLSLVEARVVAAIGQLAESQIVENRVGACGICGRTRSVVSLVK